ncbi:polysaccharide ABC transporter ATP-binding protein [Microbacterium horticulturae]|uniref:Polysaccharide ABC transporter ATP-binding protein n=1 Tax=Microbacterium horticulturae TaxID=3028316 RepID=A0ABY8C298_9MICO|nr:polysaccharide ABC transporter ATP-binding protein [Microbacterium sp. KACC 23027]WEG09181.1 polysaccharide ABC transporter ATP-binding protein [Microbacterium sp. KACC 23027]
MSDNAISVRHLSKTYRIARSSERHNRITDAVLNRLRHPMRRTRYDEFPAVDDMSFDIPWGEAVGIIGRNGAGKSTLLKLLTRITAPTAGVIDLGGRVGSLLEIGTGFHPELTGRENIFLNGSLLGMTRREIARRFDEIVEFSGVGKFLDTQVKRYSSGMYVRLAFAVAAHLETEILAIDEVLAVGDAEFQAKSLAKMRDVAHSGRTVLYVSHQPQTVTSLCSSALFLERGSLSYVGGVDAALARYRDTFERFQVEQSDAARRPGSGQLRFTRVTMTEEVVEPTDDKTIEFEIGANSELAGKYFVSCHINDVNGNVVVQCDSRLSGAWFEPGVPQHGRLLIRALWLKPGRYSIDMFICQAGILDRWEAADTIDVLPSSPYPEIAADDAIAAGMVLADFNYEVQG